MKTALVTGGTRGIGKAIARALARDGWRLALCGTRPSARGLPRGALYVQADVADPAARARLVKAAGRIDLLVNNAGISHRVRCDLLDADEAEFERIFRTNAQGPFFLTQLVARGMVRRRRGCIINISSISATHASPTRGAYCLSKAAVAMSTKIWAARLAPHGIPVYEVRPGVIATDMTAPVKAKYDRLIAAGLTLEPRWGRSDDVAKAVALLARGELSYATGQVIMVDGGLAVQRL